MGAWYKSHRIGFDADFPDEDLYSWSQSLIQGAGSQLTKLMDQSSISSIQACILLGSYYVCHGKPNLSFALLGATIRTAQAIGLHRQPLRETKTISRRGKEFDGPYIHGTGNVALQHDAFVPVLAHI
jgi:hypothetical protein